MAELPDGDHAPASGALPDPDVTDGFSAYVHIPFCTVRCGYCDFNTYTNLDFGGGASANNFADTIGREIELSARVLGAGVDARDSSAAGPLRTVFFGGGTPTKLPPQDLVEVLGRLRDRFGLADDAEITTEANPESVTREDLETLKKGGFTRISFGMQSSVPHVLAVLDRLHTPGQVERVVAWAKELGLEHSVDLIYGAPGETLSDWQESLDTAVGLDPDHISAYGLTIEKGTKMGAQLERGDIPEPDGDELAEKYLMAERTLSAAGYEWYEVSNWSKPGRQCRHNLLYWTNRNWWGYGPGAHSHINGTRFWNVKHPVAYAGKLEQGVSPAAAREVLSDAERREEDIMLGVRLAEGIDVPVGTTSTTVAGFIADELIEPASALRGRLVLTPKGRLLADTVIRELW